MAEPHSAPHVDIDPAVPDASTAHEHDKEDHKPRDSKGWDGKLRVDKTVVVKQPADPNAPVQSDAEESEDEGPAPEELAADEDLLDDVPDDEDEIELVHCKISDMSSLKLERFKQLKVPADHPHCQASANVAASLPAPKPHTDHRDT